MLNLSGVSLSLADTEIRHETCRIYLPTTALSNYGPAVNELTERGYEAIEMPAQQVQDIISSTPNALYGPIFINFSLDMGRLYHIKNCNVSFDIKRVVDITPPLQLQTIYQKVKSKSSNAFWNHQSCHMEKPLRDIFRKAPKCIRMEQLPKDIVQDAIQAL